MTTIDSIQTIKTNEKARFSYKTLTIYTPHTTMQTEIQSLASNTERHHIMATATQILSLDSVHQDLDITKALADQHLVTQDMGLDIHFLAIQDDGTQDMVAVALITMMMVKKQYSPNHIIKRVVNNPHQQLCQPFFFIPDIAINFYNFQTQNARSLVNDAGDDNRYNSNNGNTGNVNTGNIDD